MAEGKNFSVEDTVKDILKQEFTEIMTKPLPQILDEMESNIRSATEASRKAEEAGAATSASSEVTKKAEEFRKDLKIAAEKFTNQAITEIIKKETTHRFELLEDRIKKIEASIPKQKTIILREVTREEAKSEIEQLFRKSNILYYSDIAEKLRIDLELVVDICEELVKEGKVKIAEGS
jgi:hypothetical protein